MEIKNRQRISSLHGRGLLFLLFLLPALALAPLSPPREEPWQMLEEGLLRNDATLVEKALKLGAHPDFIGPPSKREARMLAPGAPLVMAVERKNLKMVKLLISYGAKINTSDPIVHSHDGGVITPLIAAIKQGSLEIVRFLLEEGAFVHSKYISEGIWDEPLSLAIVRGEAAMVKLLLEYGANPNTVHVFNYGCKGAYGGGFAPGMLELAVIFNRLNIARLLLEAGGKLDRGQKRRITLLAITPLRARSPDFLKFLAKEGVEFHYALDQYNKTPLMHLAEVCSLEIQHAWSGEKIKDSLYRDMVFGYYWTSRRFHLETTPSSQKQMYQACKESIEVMLAYGAKLNYRTKYGTSAFSYALSWMIDPETKKVVSSYTSKPQKAPPQRELTQAEKISITRKLMRENRYSPLMGKLIELLLQKGALL